MSDITRKQYQDEVKAFWSNKCKQLQAENGKLKEAYNEIFENYIPLEKMDEANNKLILLIKGEAEQMGIALLSKP